MLSFQYRYTDSRTNREQHFRLFVAKRKRGNGNLLIIYRKRKRKMEVCFP